MTQSFINFIVIISVCFCSVLAADTLTIIADPWCPYNCEPNSDLPGYGIEIAEYAFGKAGHTVVYQNINWARAIKDTKVGKYNALISAYKDDAPGFIFPEEEFGIAKVGIFILKSKNWSYRGLASLKQLSQIGIINGYAYGEAPMNFISQNPSIFDLSSGNNALELNIKKLELGRLNGVFEDPNVFMMTAARLGVQDKVRLAGEVNDGDKLYFAFSPALNKSQEYADILSSGIKELIKTGNIHTLLNKYGLKYWQQR